jgi:hypothetical protein
MNFCGLSSTGLNDIDANNITSDNTTIFSNLNVSGFSTLNELLVNDDAILNETTILSSLNISGFAMLNNKTTFLSSLNVSGFTNLDKATNVNGSLSISGLNVLDTLNSYSTSFSILNDTTSQNQITLITLGTGISTLCNFRSDNPNALVTRVNDTTIIQDFALSFYDEDRLTLSVSFDPSQHLAVAGTVSAGTSLFMQDLAH